MLVVLSSPFLIFAGVYIVVGWAAFIARYASACSQTPGVEQHWLYYLFGFGCVGGALIAGESDGEKDWRKYVAAVAYIIFAFSPTLAERPYGWAIDRILGSPTVAVSPADEAIKRDDAAAAKVDEPIMRDDVAAQNHGSMLICGTAVGIVVGMVLLLLLSRLIGRVQFSLGTAFWCSFSGHIFGTIVGLLMGFLFAYHMAIGLLIALAISWAFQTVIFQIFVCAKTGRFSSGGRLSFLSSSFWVISLSLRRSSHFGRITEQSGARQLLPRRPTMPLSVAGQRKRKTIGIRRLRSTQQRSALIRNVPRRTTSGAVPTRARRLG